MVTPYETIAALAGTSYGPVTFTPEGLGLQVAFDGATARIEPGPSTLVVTAEAACDWPEGSEGAADARGRAAPRELAASRAELCTVEARRTSRSVLATVWIDGEGDAGAVAAAARTAVLLARVATAVMAGLAQEAAAETALLRAQAAAASAADEAEKALALLVSRESAGEPAGPPAPPPTAKPASPPPSAVLPPAGNAQCVATAAVPVRDLRISSRTAGSLQPGATYEALVEERGWVHVRGHGLEGWVPAGAIRRPEPGTAAARGR